ncbi:trypsin alpha-like [Musca autumnalis]|uniref:trypsin alpha-like n=1 Tax=Musca autumnalis TaxID=221902 RepID=UPI003CF5C8EE
MKSLMLFGIIGVFTSFSSFQLGCAQSVAESKNSNPSSLVNSTTNKPPDHITEGVLEDVNIFEALNVNLSEVLNENTIGESKANKKGQSIGVRQLDIEQAPYHVALFQDNYFVCAASIISSDWIVTAAHCVYGGGTFGIRFGTTDCRKGGRIRHITTVVINSRFKIASLDNDIALLRLNKPFRWSSSVQPLSLPAERLKFPRKSLISGWGSIEENNVPKSFGAVEVNAIPRSACRKEYSNAINITKNMICAKSSGTQACQADSGSPLVRRGILYGIVTFDSDCGRSNSPAIYTDVRKQCKWIRNVVRHHGGEQPVIVT